MDNLLERNGVFSIGNVAEVGLKYGMKPGEWYGPVTMIQILEELNSKYKPFPDLNIISFPESIIYIEKLRELITPTFTPLILFVSFRLGLKKINPEYFDSIIKVMGMKGFMGIAGAQDDSALYFVGYQDKNLIYLDPHVTQKAVKAVSNLWVDHMTYHCPSTLALPLNKLNTCFSIGNLIYKKKGFYLRTKEDYDSFIEKVQAESKLENSFLQICEKRIDYEPTSVKEEMAKIGDKKKTSVFIMC